MSRNRQTPLGRFNRTDENWRSATLGCGFNRIPAILQAVWPGAEKHREQSVWTTVALGAAFRWSINRPNDGQHQRFQCQGLSCGNGHIAVPAKAERAQAISFRMPPIPYPRAKRLSSKPDLTLRPSRVSSLTVRQYKSHETQQPNSTEA